MAAIRDTELERLRYWQGQILRSKDFRDQDALDARRRVLHNRALHGVSGVRFGLQVSVDPKNASELVVDCGVAYDCMGRELAVRQQLRVMAPTEAASVTLRYGAEGTEMLLQTGTAEVSALDVTIAKLVITAGAAAVDPEFRPRAARPIARLRLARGETVRGNTPWEIWAVAQPDGKGGLVPKVVGVQTHIDTSAAGFTDVPIYMATLTGPEWDLAKTEFAPTFFPHVAEPSVDGFVFRLLMAETGRRRYNALAGTARVAQVTRLAADQMRIEVDSPGPFRPNDRIALLRPRGDDAHFVVEQTGLEVTLHAALPGTVTPGTTVLAIGNVPRAAAIESFAGNAAVLVPYQSATTLKRNDILVRLSDRAATTISASSAASGTRVLTVRLPLTAWKKEDPAGYALIAGASAVDSAQASADGSRITLALKTADASIKKGSTVVLLSAQKKLLSAAAAVISVTGLSVELGLPAGLGAAADVKLVSLVKDDITILDVKPQGSGMTVKVASASQLREGDFVAPSNNVEAVTVVERIDEGGQEVTLRDTLNLAGAKALLAANWVTATSVNLPPIPSAPLEIVVGRAGAVVPPCFVARVDGNGMSDAAVVKAATGTEIRTDKPIAGLARLDMLAVGVFPRIVTVAAQQGPQTVLVQEADALRRGDVVVKLATGPESAALADVVSAGGTVIQLRRSLGALMPGDLLGVVHFSDTAELKAVAANGRITVDRDIAAREGDFVAVLTHYVENSAIGSIQTMSGNLITLAPDGFAAGDGILPAGRIDGGILGQASVSFPAQPLIRLESSEGLTNNSGRRQDTVIGFDLTTGVFRSVAVQAFVVDSILDGVPNGTLNRVVLIPRDLSSQYSLRPETLSLITTFNTDFPRAFATFAQEQKLCVCWSGYQQELHQTFGCGGGREVRKPCEGSSST